MEKYVDRRHDSGQICAFMCWLLHCYLCFGKLTPTFIIFALSIFYLPVCLFIAYCFCFPFFVLWYVSVSLPVSLPICLSVCLSVCLSIVISLFHHLLVASVCDCCQSGLCTHLSLLFELRVHLRLTVGLSFGAFSSSTHFLVLTSALDGLFLILTFNAKSII